MTELLQQPVFFALVAAVIGLCVGSFLNVVIHRLPKMMERQWRAECAELSGQGAPAAERYNLVLPRSACPHCGHRIIALENIPVLSWLLLRGRCSACGTAISVRYPAVELLSGLLSAYVAWRFGFGLAGCGALVFVWAMIALTFIDIDTFFLSDSITLPLLWLGLLLNIGGVYAALPAAVIGAAAGYLSLWSVYWAFKWATGKEGMGYGDFKLLAAICAWLGWSQLPLVILLSAMAGASVGLGMIVLGGRDRAKPIPFGPYLAIAGVVALLHGETITRAYLGPL
ncbi:MAG: A24 family peptidase [Betaproteobacteria bacterium]|jgi:leader peptidase (prepilin peptidase)/N-methyltransferase|nr:A24 family peptidase [Betaproteobacteria bacterium]